VPSAYRGVSVAEIEGPLTDVRLRTHFLGREAYRRTRFLAVRNELGEAALVGVEKESEEPLFSRITQVTLLAGPDECAFVVDSAADTAVPSELARVALAAAPAARAVIVQGRYEHVSFIIDPDPLRVVVHEVVPPHPAKLVDQVQRVLNVAEDLPPMLVVPDLVNLAEVMVSEGGDHYLLPCRGSGVDVEGVRLDFLDQRPTQAPWQLVGCARSREIHQWFYGAAPQGIDMCPRERTRDADQPTITKCCLLEDAVVTEGRSVVVPWGATLPQVRAALETVASIWEPTWQPV
jgi:hypothetical protein